MVSQQYAIYAEEVFKPSIDDESTQYVLADLWKGTATSKNSEHELADLLFDELPKSVKKEKFDDGVLTEIAHEYLPPIRIAKGIMIIPRHLTVQELRFVAREYAQKFKNPQ
ncbi:hypothetical protein HY485_02215 [Candidatus Woesearchaeota archaeon]|nr:hypothetical protein [Candidatus Woesearchaeota archaeon]